MDESTVNILNELADCATARVLSHDYRAIQGTLLAGEGVRVIRSKRPGPDGHLCTTRVSMALEKKSTISLRVSVTWARCSVDRAAKYRWHHARRRWEIVELPEDNV